MVTFSPPPPSPNAGSDTSKLQKIITSSHRCCSTSSSFSNNITTIDSQEASKKFSYSGASPSIRYPNRKELTENHNSHQTKLPISPTTPQFDVFEDECLNTKPKDKEIKGKVKPLDTNDETLKGFGWQSRRVAKKMTKLALKRAKDWRQRVQFLADKILGLKSNEFVADVLDDKLVQMTPADFCFLVKGVGKSNWQRALEVYEWLNLCQLYSLNPRMLATILAVLGKANQESLAVEIFERSEEGIDSSVQVYNAMMGVYARNFRFVKVQEMLNRMCERGCEPDLVSFKLSIH